MKHIRERYPVFLSIAVLLITLLASFAGTFLVLGLYRIAPGLQQAGDYTIQLIVELIMLAVLILLTFLLRMQHIFRERGVGFFRSLLPLIVILGLYYNAGISTVLLSLGDPLHPPLEIFSFILCMCAIGITEELAFRGLITRMIFDKYGTTSTGVWLSVVSSGIIFGLMHLVNAVGGIIPLSGVLIQVLGAAALGMCLSAAYVRCKNLWAVAAVHAFMDFSALLSSGVFNSTTIAETVGGYSPIMLVSMVFYLGIALFILRPKKMAQITSVDSATTGTRVKLAVSVLLLVIMVAAVLMLTLFA